MNRFQLALTFIAGILAADSLLADAIPSAALAEKSAQRLTEIRRALGLDEQHTFRIQSFRTDQLSQTHTRFQQYYKGVRVWGGDGIVHMDAQGRELPLTSAFKQNIDLDVTPTRSGAEALSVAHADLDPRGPYAYAPTAELVIYPEAVSEVHPERTHLAASALNAADMVSRVKRYVLAYHVHTELENPGDTRHTDYLVDARTGTIIDKWDSLLTASVIGTGKSQYSGTVSLNANSVVGGYELRDPTRPVSLGNVVYNLDHGTSGAGAIYQDADNTWGDGGNFKEAPEPTTSPNGQTAAVDAAFGLQATWDMYKNVFGRNGIDGLGSPVYARVHYDSAYDNAFYSDECLCITYGDGTKLQTLTALDIAAHEFSHGVCSTTAGLIYNKESGGLNEANSDIMGAMTEFYARGTGGQGNTIPDTGGNWTQGEQATTPAYPLKMRFLYKPSKDGKSADAWSPTLQNLDVHYSSGPMNRAFYFLSQGSSTDAGSEFHSTYLPGGMAGIGNDKAAKIWFRALTTYMTSSTDYASARIASIQAARDLFGVSGPEEIAVWNAFAAINVGSPWAGPDTPPTVTVSEVGDKGTLTFSATASDDKGVVKVEFLLDGTLVGTSTTPPYSMSFDSLKEDDGIHTLTAKATDTTGQFTNATMSFTLANGQLIRNGSFEKGYGVGWSNTPGIQIGAILGQTAYDGTKMAKLCGMGSRITASLYQSVSIPAQASSAVLSYALHIETKESSSGVEHDTLAVQLRDGSGTVLKTLASYSDRNAAAGYKVYSHDLAAYKGRTIQLYFLGNEDSAVATSFILDKVNLNVTGGGDSQPPTITVTETGSSGMIGFSATATDNVGVAKVEFYVDGVLKGTVTSPPHTVTFDSTLLAKGEHTLVGKAYDAAGNVGSSPPVGFFINNETVDTQPPSIFVSASGSSGTIGFSADATDNVGVTRVEFYVDGAIKGTVNSPPYTMAFDSTILPDGSHTLTGKAYDAAGNVGSSSPLPFTVNNGGGAKELILDGGFESGGANWSGNGRIGAFPAQPAYEGSECAWLGGKGAANTAELYQAVTIPNTAASATLSYALHIDSAEKTSWLHYDTAVVQVRDGGSVLKTLASYSNLDKVTGYVHKSFDLSAYKGQAVQIYIKAVEDSSYQTSFVFDQVSLSVR